MAVNESRSMTNDFKHGIADGSVKSLAPDRGGEVESLPLYEREMALRMGSNPLDSISRSVEPYPRDTTHIG